MDNPLTVIFLSDFIYLFIFERMNNATSQSRTFWHNQSTAGDNLVMLSHVINQQIQHLQDEDNKKEKKMKII